MTGTSWEGQLDLEPRKNTPFETFSATQKYPLRDIWAEAEGEVFFSGDLFYQIPQITISPLQIVLNRIYSETP